MRHPALSAALLTIGVAFQSAWASADNEVQVFSEHTSFEAMLSDRRSIERSPAAIQPLARVIGVRREMGLSDAESAAAPQDIILNGGVMNGLSEGMSLGLFRKIPVIDPYRENASRELEIEFGSIEILHVEKEVAVARVKKIESNRTGLFVGTRSPLVGDFVATAKR